MQNTVSLFPFSAQHLTFAFFRIISIVCVWVFFSFHHCLLLKMLCGTAAAAAIAVATVLNIIFGAAAADAVGSSFTLALLWH